VFFCPVWLEGNKGRRETVGAAGTKITSLFYYESESDGRLDRKGQKDKT